MAAFVVLFDGERRRRRVFRERLDSLDNFDDDEIVQRYRLPRAGIIHVAGLIDDDVSPKTARNQSLNTMTKLMITLRFLGKGNFYSETGDIHGVSRATVSRCLHQVVGAVNRRLRNIRYPTGQEELSVMKRSFYRISQVPNVIGAVDGTLIPIAAPITEDEPAYVCRKGFHALNVQAVVSSDMRFTDVVAKWPGSQHDAMIFDSCSLKRTFLERGDHGWLLGDSGYPLRPYLMTPVARPATEAEVRYNTAHSKTRVVVERSFGVLKSRFRCLHKSGGGLPFCPTMCAEVVVACFRLHNLCIELGAPMPEDIQHFVEINEIDEVDHLPNEAAVSGRDRRAQLVQRF